MRKCNHPGLFVKQCFQGRPFHFGGLRVDLPFTNHHTLGFQATPCTDIGLVVLVGDNHLITGLQMLTQRLGKHIGIL